MRIDVDEKWHELDTYINTLKQSIIIIGDDSAEEKIFMNAFKDYLRNKPNVAYIDIADITDIKALALKFVQQYELLLGIAPEYEIYDEDYTLLDFSLKLFSGIKDAEEIIVLLDNFTEILKLKNTDQACKMLRGAFQHQDNIVHVFTSNNKDDVSKIFSDYDKPFYHFAKLISLAK